MQSPSCPSQQSRVIASRQAKDGKEIRRRRECESCGRRFTTYEREEEALPMVVKKDGRREPFDRQKLLRGLKHAFTKRPVSLAALEALAEEIERELGEANMKEVDSKLIG